MTNSLGQRIDFQFWSIGYFVWITFGRKGENWGVVRYRKRCQ